MDHRTVKEQELDSFLRQALLERSHGGAVRASIAASAPNRRNFRKIVLLSVLIIAILGGPVLFLENQLRQSTVFQNGNGQRAVLIDELSMTDHDTTFVRNVNRSLTAAGYAVDYFGPKDVTVELFRNLPLRNYAIVIIRSHTAGESIVTSQPYSTSQYVLEQLLDRVGAAEMTGADASYFTISPSFILDSMHGSFHGALVIAMGCGTFQGATMAKAFIQKGASVFVGWTDFVSSGYTDAVTQNLVSSLTHGMSVGNAVQNAGGPDPQYHSQLGYLTAATVSQSNTPSYLAPTLYAAIILATLVLGPATILLIPKLGGRR